MSECVLARINPAALFSVHERESDGALAYLAMTCSADAMGAPVPAHA